MFEKLIRRSSVSRSFLSPDNIYHTYTTSPDRQINVDLCRLGLSSWPGRDGDPTTSRFGLLGKPWGHRI